MTEVVDEPHIYNGNIGELYPLDFGFSQIVTEVKATIDGVTTILFPGRDYEIQSIAGLSYIRFMGEDFSYDLNVDFRTYPVGPAVPTWIENETIPLTGCRITASGLVSVVVHQDNTPVLFERTENTNYISRQADDGTLLSGANNITLTAFFNPGNVNLVINGDGMFAGEGLFLLWGPSDVVGIGAIGEGSFDSMLAPGGSGGLGTQFHSFSPVPLEGISSLNLQSGGTFPAIRGFFCEGAGNTASIIGVYPIDNIGNQYGLRLVLTPTMVHQYISTDSGATWIEISAVPRQPGWVGIPAVGIGSLHCGGVALNASKFNAVPFPPLKPTVAMQSYWTTFDLKFMQTTAPAGTLIPDISAHTFWVSYSYGSTYLGESSGSSGLEHIVPHVDLPGPFDLLGGITKWSLIRVIKLKGYKIKGVKIYFPPGCRNYVKIKLMYNGNSWIPEENYSDPIQGDGRIIYIPANRVISPNDYIEVWYRNLDVSPHRLDIQLDIHNDRTNSMIQDDPSERRLGRETEAFIETYEDEGD